MPFRRAKTPEELAAEEAARVQREAQEAQERVARERDQFLRSPLGQARTAYEAGDEILQISLDVMTQHGEVDWVAEPSAPQQRVDPTDVLNAVGREGWELVTGSFVFVPTGESSRDRFVVSGQNTAIEGTTTGYYLFRRNPALRRSAG